MINSLREKIAHVKMQCKRDFGEIDSSVKFVDNADISRKLRIDISNMTAEREWIAPDETAVPLGESNAQTVTNKTLDSDLNTLLNVRDVNVAADAGIDCTKLGDGSVSNVEFSYLNGLTGPIQNQLIATTVMNDRQMVLATDLISTVSSTWIDVPDMTLTTHDFGAAGCYMIKFNAKVTTSSSSHEAEARVVIGGVAKAGSEMSWVGAPDNTEDYVPFPLEWMEENVPAGTVIKIQFRAVDTSTTVYVQNRKLIIDGVPQATLV